tara:strand:- start:385 stop:1500 length:1116 start_codon:yes stop_codon:yes gene_type:complete
MILDNYIILTIFIIISFIITELNKLLINNNNLKLLENFISYTKCNKYKNTNILQNILNKNEIKKTNSNKWDIYLPCTYTNLENELKSIDIQNNNQKIFGIDGTDKMVSKDILWKTFFNKYGRKFSSKCLPETYLLNDKKDMNLFIDNYSKNNIYILKKNIQRKEGIKITNDLNYILKAKYEKFVVVQKYINNLYLLNKRKINLRIYLLIICKNNKIKWYISKLGKCIYTNKNYSNDYNNLESHLTSLNLNSKIYDKNPFSLFDLKKYLGDNNFNKLFKNIIEICIHCKNCFNNIICTNNNLNNTIRFQLYGLDFIFDNNFNCYLLELNKGPQMSYINNEDKKMKNKLHEDIFDLVKIKRLSKNKRNDFIKI